MSGITLSPPSLILSLSLEVPVFLPFTRKSGVFSVTADQKLARLEIQGQQRELKFFFPNYKDYLKVNFLCKEHHTALHKFELIPPPIIDLEKIADKTKEVS